MKKYNSEKLAKSRLVNSRLKSFLPQALAKIIQRNDIILLEFFTKKDENPVLSFSSNCAIYFYISFSFVLSVGLRVSFQLKIVLRNV